VTHDGAGAAAVWPGLISYDAAVVLNLLLSIVQLIDRQGVPLSREG
jgi:hypothetical protein